MYVYILKLDHKIFYTGITCDIKRRLKEHSKSKKGFTSKFKKKELVFLINVKDRITARKIEIYIKKTGALRYLITQEKSIKKDTNTLLYNKSLLNKL